MENKRIKPTILIKKKEKSEKNPVLQFIEKFRQDLDKKDDNIYDFYFIDYDDIIFDLAVFFKCVNCAFFGSYYTCPPFSSKPHISKEKFKKYEKFILIFVRKDMGDINNNLNEKEKEWKKPNLVTKLLYGQAQASRTNVHKVYKIALDLRDYLRSCGYDAMGYQSGGCRLCLRDGCAFKIGEKCRNPEKMLSSPEGIGIDLYTTCRKKGIPIEIPPRDIMTQIGLVIYKTN